MRMVLHRLRYDVCLLIILFIALSILLLEYIVNYSIGVQIPLYNLFELQFELIYFLNSRSFLLAWSQIISVASKLFDMVQVQIPRS
jgi:hypothetical protein